MTDLVSDLQRSIATIIRIQKILEPSVETAHKTYKFAPPDIQTLRYISEHPNCMSGAIAKFLGVVPTTMTSVIDRLVKRGFVDRHRPEDNRRAIALNLTEEGQKVLAQILAEDLQAVGMMLNCLPSSQHEQFVGSMRQIASTLAASRGEEI